MMMESLFKPKSLKCDLPPLSVTTFRERISVGANQGRAREATREEVRCVWIFVAWLVALSTGLAADLEPPTIPVGLDAYRQWERWPYQRIGARAYMRSTYDRTGGN
jgi:hypothetical protein